MNTPSFGRTAPTLPVTDVARALEFYVGVLGMEKVFENGDPIGFAIVKKDVAEIHLERVASHVAGEHNVMHLVVSDATALYERVTGAGTPIVKGIRDADFGLRCFVMADPDGNRIDVGEPLP